jgi:hypothetical protein
MKAKIALLFFLLYGLIYAQNSFIIGADWLNSMKKDRFTNIVPMSQRYWELIDSLNLNFGTLTCLDTNNGLIQNIRDILDRANAHNVKIELCTVSPPFIEAMVQNNTHLQRWMFQIEGNNDFSTHGVGIGEPDPNSPGPELHWSLVNDGITHANCWNLDTSSYNAGIVVDSFNNNDTIPDGNYYYMKIKLKKVGNDITNDSVITVSLINKLNSSIHMDTVLIASDLPNDSWVEKDLFWFYQSSVGPTNVLNPDTNVIIDYSAPIKNPSTWVTKTPFEIIIFWNGKVNCKLDYIIFENYSSSELHKGRYDNMIFAGVDKYLNKPALLYYKLWDEPDSMNYLPVRYARNLIQGYLNLHDRREKNSLVFNAYHDPQKFLAQTQMNIHRCDIYPIIPSVPLPGGANYLSEIQFSMQAMNSFLNNDILHSIKFEKDLWFTPQAHRWDPVEGQRREPSAYELKLMTNLGVAYGAKGIQYYMYAIPYDQYNNNQIGVGFLNDDDPQTPLPRYYDTCHYEKWNTIRELNSKIASQGSMLMSLAWNSSYYIHDALPSGKYITNVQSYYCPTCQNPLELESNPYIQFSFFDSTPQDNNKERFYVINRRTLPDEARTIRITYNKTQTNPSNLKNWTIREVGTSNYWSGKDTGSYQTLYSAAEGKLFTLEPTVFTGGNLDTNETISGTYTLSGDLTIKSGVTLTVNGAYNINANINIESNGVLQVTQGGTINIQKGKTLSFADNTGMTINGTLTADSVIFKSNGTGSWGYLTFDGTGAVNSYLHNVKVKYGAGIKCLNGADIDIESSILDTCTMGIYIYNSAPQIFNNQINDPLGNGIYGQAYLTSPYILGNKIYKLTDQYNYLGIFLINGILPRIVNNDINGFDFGIYIGGGSVSHFYNNIFNNQEAPYPNNRFTNNNIGMCAGWGSTIFGGSWYNGGYNSIFGNSLDAYAYVESDILAYNDYWGESGLNYEYDESSSIEIDNILSVDPWEQSNLKLTGNQGNAVNHLNKSAGDIFSGLLLEQNGNIDEAITFYKNLISNNQHIDFSLLELLHLYTKYSRNEILSYLNNFLTSNNRYNYKVKKLLADYSLKNNQFNNAISSYDDIIKNDPNEMGSLNARFEKLFAYLNIKKDRNTASQLLSELKALNIKDRESKEKMKIADFLIKTGPGLNKENMNIIINFVPLTYALFQNYPNPFNPHTTIQYQIPKPGIVTLKVYDILGKEVATLVNENILEGTYEVNFNASRFASGVYIYQLRAGNFIASKKMLLIK